MKESRILRKMKDCMKSLPIKIFLYKTNQDINADRADDKKYLHMTEKIDYKPSTDNN